MISLKASFIRLLRINSVKKSNKGIEVYSFPIGVFIVWIFFFIAGSYSIFFENTKFSNLAIYFFVLAILSLFFKSIRFTVCDGKIIHETKGLITARKMVYKTVDLKSTNVANGLGSTGGLVLLAKFKTGNVIIVETDIRPNFKNQLNYIKKEIDSVLID